MGVEWHLQLDMAEMEPHFMSQTARALEVDVELLIS